MVRPESARDRHGTRMTRSGALSEGSSSRNGCPSHLSSQSSSSSMQSSSSATAKNTLRSRSSHISGEQRARCSFGSSQSAFNARPVQPQRREVRAETQQDRPYPMPGSPPPWRTDLPGRYRGGYRVNQMDYYRRSTSRDVPNHSGISSRTQGHGVLSSVGGAGLRKPQIRTHSPAQRKLRKPLQRPRPRGNDTTCAGRTA